MAVEGPHPAFVAGDRDRFAIECHLLDHEDEWVWGSFFCWAGGERLGDPEDSAVLNACFGWIRDVPTGLPKLRNERYARMPLAKLAPQLLDIGGMRSDEAPHNLTYIGMTSLLDHGDSIAVVRSADGRDRLLWWRKEQAARDLVLDPGVLEGVLREAIEGYAAALAELCAQGGGR